MGEIPQTVKKPRHSASTAAGSHLFFCCGSDKSKPLTEGNNVTTKINQYHPDYAVPPGAILEECLETHGISPAEFARRCGRSAKLINKIIAGKAPVAPETAREFEKVSGVDAAIWLGIEKDYQRYRARAREAKKTKKATA